MTAGVTGCKSSLLRARLVHGLQIEDRLQIEGHDYCEGAASR